MSHWSFSVPWPVLLLAAAVWLASAWLAYTNWRRRNRNRTVGALEALRLLVMTMIVFTLLRPEFVRQLRFSEKPEIVILTDASASMQTRDVVAATNHVVRRLDWVKQNRQTNFWRPLEKDAKVIVEDFAKPPTNIVAVPVEEGTDINQALETVLQRQKNLKAVLVLSDGDWNLGQSPLNAAMRYRAQQVPIYTVAVGNEAMLPDLVIEHVSAPSYGLLGEQIAVPFKIQSHLPREVKTTLTLQSEKGVAVTKPITIPPFAQVHDSLVWLPPAMGDYNLTVKLPVEPDEYLRDNNERSFRLSVRTEKLNVLVVESLPRWEYRYLRNALTRDPGVEARTLLFHPGMSVGGGKNYLPAFPDSKEELTKYDVVFLGDVGLGEKELAGKDVELLKGLIEQQGSGLVFLPGPRGRQLTLARSPLSELLPVTFDEGKPDGLNAPTESQLLLTSAARGHFLTMLAPDENRNEEIWKTLPGFYWCAAVQKSRPGSEVLAVHSLVRAAAGRMPLLVTRPYGNGEVLFMGTDSAWRWRRGVEDKYHYRFWGQVVRWMAHKRHLAQKQGIRLSFSPENPRTGENVFLNATVLDAGGLPLERGTVTARIVSPSGKTERLDLTAVPGGWGVFQAGFLPREGGKYRVTISSERAARELDTEIVVTRPQREKLGQPANYASLREIADLTRGAFGTVQDLDRIVRQISLLPEARAIERRTRLWANPWWGGLIVLLLAIYWTARKLTGMI